MTCGVITEDNWVVYYYISYDCLNWSVNLTKGQYLVLNNKLNVDNYSGIPNHTEIPSQPLSINLICLV